MGVSTRSYILHSLHSSRYLVKSGRQIACKITIHLSSEALAYQSENCTPWGQKVAKTRIHDESIKYGHTFIHTYIHIWSSKNRQQCSRNIFFFISQKCVQLLEGSVACYDNSRQLAAAARFCCCFQHSSMVDYLTQEMINWKELS